jgi:adenylosuccinate synthase
MLALRYAVRVNGLDGIAITKLDVLTGFEKLKIAVAYKVGGRTLDEMPSDPELLERCEPVYEELPGWSEKVDGLRALDAFPRQAQAYIRRVEQLSGVKVAGLSVGADRGETILLENPFRR